MTALAGVELESLVSEDLPDLISVVKRMWPDFRNMNIA